MATIVCRKVSFGYDGAARNIFEDLGLLVDTGWRTALTGRNGRGKTWRCRSGRPLSWRFRQLQPDAQASGSGDRRLVPVGAAYAAMASSSSVRCLPFWL